MDNEALNSRSQLKISGSDVDVKMNSEDKERVDEEHDRKAAVKLALADIN